MQSLLQSPTEYEQLIRVTLGLCVVTLGPGLNFSTLGTIEEGLWILTQKTSSESFYIKCPQLIGIQFGLWSEKKWRHNLF